MTDPTSPAAPDGTGPAGLRLWSAITEDYDLDPHELALLTEAVRTVDQLDLLDEIVRRDGPTINGRTGLRVHPALVEARQLRLVLARLVASLRLPDEHDERPQRRGAARGIYNGRKYGSFNLLAGGA